MQLAGGPEKTRPPTGDVLAYDFYLKASTAFFDGRFSAALRCLDQAIARDPGFAQAYARRGFVYMAALNSGIGVIEDPAERNRAAQHARGNAERALALDPTLGLPHSVLAEIHVYHWRWEQTRPEYEQALVLSPNEPFSIVVLSYYLTFTGNNKDEERAWELAQRLVELDPRSAEMYVNKGYISLYLGKPNEAAASFREALSLNPTVYEGIAYLGLGTAESQLGNKSVALEALHNGEQLRMDETTPAKTALLIYVYGSSGQAGDARRLFQTLETLAANEYISATSWFIAYRGIGDTEQALDWLHKAIDTHDTYGQLFRQMAKRRFFPDLWDNPRFQEARRKVGYTD